MEILHQHVNELKWNVYVCHGMMNRDWMFNYQDRRIPSQYVLRVDIEFPFELSSVFEEVVTALDVPDNLWYAPKLRQFQLDTIRPDAIAEIEAGQKECEDKQNEAQVILDKLKDLTGSDVSSVFRTLIPKYTIPDDCYEIEERKCPGFGYFWVTFGSPMHRFLIDNNLMVKNWNPVNPYQNLENNSKRESGSSGKELSLGYWRKLPK